MSANWNSNEVKCQVCGMLALRDPWEHSARYHHDPEYYGADGSLLRFVSSRGKAVVLEQPEAGA